MNQMNRMTKTLNRLFFKGLFVLLPASLTIYLLIGVGVTAENFFGNIIEPILGESLYLPGMGLVISFFFVIGMGALVSNYLTAGFLNYIFGQFEKFPLFKTIYNPLKDLINLFSKEGGGNGMKRVVLIDFGDGKKMMGLVTRDEYPDFPNNLGLEDYVTVYIPMGYMLGGMAMFVPKDKVTPVDIPVDRALKLAVTAYLKS